MIGDLMVMAVGLIGDRLYDTVCAGIVFLVGMGILFKTESKTGWLFVLAGLAWAFLTWKDMIFMD